MSKNILLIEDDLILRENIAEILELSDYCVETAVNGKDGVQKAQQNSPDLIICDIMMPELDGYGVLHLLGKNPDTACIPFIFLTAKAERSDIRKGMSLGADDYLTKPFDTTELLNVVETRLRKNGILKFEFNKTSEGLDNFVSQAKELHDLVKLSGKYSTRKYPPRKNVFLEGSLPNHLYFIRSGKVKTYRMNADAKEYTVGLFREGDFFGYHALIQGAEYQNSAMTMEETELSLVPQEDFHLLLFNNREVARQFIRLLSGSVSQKEEQLLQMAYNSVRKRVAEALLLFHERYGVLSRRPFSMAIPREDLASMAGTAIETVVRALTDFKEEGLIEVSRSTITIIEPQKLARVRN